MQLSSASVTQLTGATTRRLNYWHRTGLIRASGKSTGHRRYTIPDVVAVKTIVELRRQGCSLQKIRAAVRYLRRHYPDPGDTDVLASLTLLTDGRKVYMLSEESRIMEVLSRQTVMWVLNLGRLIAETHDQTRKLPVDWVETVNVRRKPYRLRFTRDVEDGGYAVQCVELPGAIEQGRTEAEARENGKAAVESVLTFLAKRRGRRPSARKRHSA